MKCTTNIKLKINIFGRDDTEMCAHNLPGSTACTLTGESEQMVKPYPSFPRRMVTCTHTQTHKSHFVREGKDFSLLPTTYETKGSLLEKQATSFLLNVELDLHFSFNFLLKLC